MAPVKPAAPKKNTDRLSQAAKAALRHGSHEAIVTRLASLTPTLRTGRWLPKSNRYAANTVSKLALLFRKKKPAKLREGELVAYVAVSAPLHCADGWSFLGRAISALIAGDSNAARHLAYYAELRAAMSLMATQGVGIFNGAHFVVESNNHCRHVPQNRSTHKFTWDCIEHWTDLQRSTQPLMEMIRPGSVPVRQWLDQFIAGHTTSLAARWLSYWGVDLRSFPEDRDARNEASYRPAALRERPSLSVADRSAFIESLWSLCEPTQPSRFETLDRYILRDSVREIYKINTGTRWDADIADFTRRCTRMIDSVAPSGWPESSWLSFLTGSVLADRPLLLSEADDRSAGIADSRHHLKVIARAALLLRLATGASADLLARCQTSTEDLRFWWEAVGDEAGLWRRTGPPEDLTDLWADVDDALTTNREWITSASDTSVGSWVASRGVALHTLGTCERIALWGLGL